MEENGAFCRSSLAAEAAPKLVNPGINVTEKGIQHVLERQIVNGMARLDNPKRKSFSQSDFEQYPVWAWDDSNEIHQPITDIEPALEDYGTLFIKASFQTSGHSFNGYLIGGTVFYAFGLFVREREFVMNLRLPDMMETSLREIIHLLECPPFNLFPLQYSSEVRLRGGRQVSGVLAP